MVEERGMRDSVKEEHEVKVGDIWSSRAAFDANPFM
jgi:hypothetical protein